MSFASQLRAFGDKAERKQYDALRKVAFSMFSRVILRTPVDTGRLRGNWQATLGAPASGEVDTLGADAAIREMQDVVLGEDSPTVFHLTNTLPYASTIEYGNHSKQAPQGMVRISAAEFQDVVADMRL